MYLNNPQKKNYTFGGGISSNKAYLTLKYKNKQLVKLNTKKLTNNNFTKLIRISL